jgi:CRISPR-associated Csx2 family protein
MSWNSVENNERKKLLFLTLGTGAAPGEENNKAAYRTTTYIMHDAEKNEDFEYVSNFVAEPIINSFKPDEIFILGTVKSVWHQLFASFITKDNEDDSYLKNDSYKKLIDIARDKNLGNASSDDEIKQIQNIVTEIFHELEIPGVCKKFSGKSLKINILITKYGINEKQLKENYAIIKGIENKLKRNVKYEVAFDITHSFRSLPIYNLIVFNYIKNITKYNLDITSIYYGNVEVSRELGNAYIVDLKDLVNVLDLTSAAAEFKNTGNAVSLLKMLQSDDEMKEILENFDIAEQVNAFNLVKGYLADLTECCEKNENSVNRYTGVREMIAAVLESKFFGKDDITSEDIRNMPDMELKFLLTEWFFNQNRMGLGIATGLEALRDLNTAKFMQVGGFGTGDDRKYRENAEMYFIEIAKRLENKSERNELEEAVYRLGSKLREYKDIRNTFAHSLRNSSYDIGHIKAQIEQFRIDLFRLKKLYDDDRNSNSNQYEELFRKNNKKSPISESRCRIIIDFEKSLLPEMKAYKKSSTNKYDVYRLDNEVKAKGLIYGMNRGSKQRFSLEKIYFLYRYLLKHLPEGYSEIQIILFDLPKPEIETGIRIFMEKLIQDSDKKISLHKSNMEIYNKLGIPVDMQEIEQKMEDVICSYAILDNVELVRMK